MILLSMKITLNKVSKRYNYEWIFRELDYTFQSGKSYALLGPNGSGKSTLLQIIAGNIVPSEGEVIYEKKGIKTESENFFRQISFVSPYMELPEEMTFEEVINFHSGFKKFKQNLSTEKIIEHSGLKKSVARQIRFYSSGMKQRAKLTLAILTDTPVLFLDEPTTNLDETSVGWWKKLLQENSENRIVITASNIAREYELCDEQIEVNNWK